MTVIAVVLGIGAFATFNHFEWFLFFGALIGELVVLQFLYSTRIRAVRGIAARLNQSFPDDRFLIGNARFMGANDRDPRAVGFTTVILQFTKSAVAIWNPDSISTPIVAMPLAGLGVEIVKSKPPRWRLRPVYSSSDTYVAVFQPNGFRYEHFETLGKLVDEYFPVASDRSPKAAP